MFMHAMGLSGKSVIDPFFNSTSLLLHGEGADGSVTIIDNSRNHFSPAVSGNAQIDTAQKKYGAASIFFDGSGDYLTYANDSTFQFGAGNFTVEFFVRFSSLSGGQYLVSKYGSVGVREFAIGIDGSDWETVFLDGSSTIVSFSAAHGLSINTWYHIAYVRSGSNFYLFRDGVLVDTKNSASALGTTTQALEIGTVAGGNYFAGWLDEVRITKGIARYTSNFTPPAAPFPNS